MFSYMKHVSFRIVQFWWTENQYVLDTSHLTIWLTIFWFMQTYLTIH